MAFSTPNEYRITPEMGRRLIQTHDISPEIMQMWINTNNQFKGEGFFMLPNLKTGKGMFMLCKASNGSGWEHVSVSIPTERRCPTWPEMCFVKSLFWDDEDCVIQFHPPKSEYVNNHEFCLHLWKPVGKKIQTPSSLLVGIKQ